MSKKTWRGTVLFTAVLVTMGATAGLKLYGVGEQASAAQTSIHASTSGASTTKTVTGTAVETRYGIVQVKVTFEGSTIVAVDTIQSPAGNGRDIEINQQALPILQKEALASQSAKIDSVSGASYTSAGYVQSLQSAIDQS